MDSSKIQILVVDDTRTIRLQFAVIFSGHQYNVREAACGAAALLAVEEAKPDVILLDIMMPEMNGIECCQKIRANPENEDIRIVMVTGSTDYELISEAYKAGCNDYISKPIHEQKLVQKVEKLTRLSRLMKQSRSLHPTDCTT